MGKERKEHPTQKPLKVIKWLIEYLSNENDIILDPFIGSGTTALACLQLKRKFIGIEIKQGYIDMSYKRIARVQQRIF